MYIILAILLCSVYGFYLGKKKSLSFIKKGVELGDLNSKPNYHGYYLLLWCLIPSVFIFLSLSFFGNIFIK